jgi:hypothetical protein
MVCLALRIFILSGGIVYTFLTCRWAGELSESKSLVV